MQVQRFRWVFYPAAFVTLILAAVLVWLDQFLTGPHSPQGIISFELARTPDTARVIIDSWGMEGIRYATWSLILDFPFLIGYVTLLISLTLLVESPVRNLLIGGFVVAGVCDVIENLVLFQVLSGHLNPLYTSTAFWCASIKFGLLVFGWCYLLIYGIYGLYQRARER